VNSEGNQHPGEQIGEEKTVAHLAGGASISHLRKHAISKADSSKE
jgi:hypothetical protein